MFRSGASWGRFQRRSVRWGGGILAALLLLLLSSDVACRPVTAGLAWIPGGVLRAGSVEAPGGARGEVALRGFWMGRCEVTVAEWAAYLNAARVRGPVMPQVIWRGGRYTVRQGQARRPASFVSHDEAVAYCRWLARRSGRRVRLPTEAEWEYAARGGIVGARFPWGWGRPDGRACYRAAAPRRVGGFASNGFGLFDVAGNVFEWCAAPAGMDIDPPARGGSWAERDPKWLTVYRRTSFTHDYRNADVGFRILVEDP